MPLISVVICTYNRVRLLPRAVDSLLSQTITQWEGIIIDDGSTDNTSSYAETLVEVHPRFRYFRQENGGLTAARNAGLRRSLAPYVTFLDSDDAYAPEHLEVRLRVLADNPKIQMLHGGLRVVGGPDHVPDVHDLGRMIALSECFVGGTFVLRRDWALEMGGFSRPDFGNDYDFGKRATEVGAVIRRLEAPTYIYYRDTPDSMCNLVENSCQRQNSF